MLDPIGRLLLDEAPARADRVLCLDCPAELVAAARERYGDVVAYADRLDGGPSEADLTADVVAGVDLALLRLPPGLGALEDLAERLAAWGPASLRLVAAGRVKHMTRSQNDVLARSFGAVRASLGRDKCRALHASQPAGTGSFRWPKRAVEPTTGLALVARGATFNGTRLDAGTRLLLSTADRWPGGRGVDVGCGNGILSCVLAGRGNEVTAVDISRAAVASTRASLAANGLPGQVLLADGLADLPDASADVIVTNPPFHVGAAKDSTPTLRMLAAAPRVLRPDGELWCVFNSHLPYVAHLRRGFARVEVAARDRAFTVVRAR